MTFGKTMTIGTQLDPYPDVGGSKKSNSGRILVLSRLYFPPDFFINFKILNNLNEEPTFPRTGMVQELNHLLGPPASCRRCCRRLVGEDSNRITGASLNREVPP